MSVNIKQGVKRAAKEHGVSQKDFLAEIQQTIDATWNNPTGAENRAKLFPDGKPTPELFLQRIAQIVDESH